MPIRAGRVGRVGCAAEVWLVKYTARVTARRTGWLLALPLLALLFAGGMGTPLVVPEKLSFGSAQWQEALHLAKVTARRLGLEFAVATSPGWSAAGGPWVRPPDAMKKVVWSETLVTGGGQ